MSVGLEVRVEAVSVEISQVEMSTGALYASFSLEIFAKAWLSSLS